MSETTPIESNQLIPSNKVREIPMKGWGSTDAAHSVLFTHGLGPCIGVTIFDPASKKGFMGHFANPALESGALDDMFAAVHSNVDDPQRLKIWVRGGQVDEAMTKMAQEGMGIDFPQMGKDIIEARLNELLGGQATDVDIQYDSSPMSSDDAMMQRLDAEKGEFVSRAYSVGEYQIALGELSMHGIAQEGNGV